VTSANRIFRRLNSFINTTGQIENVLDEQPLVAEVAVIVKNITNNKFGGGYYVSTCRYYLGNCSASLFSN